MATTNQEIRNSLNALEWQVQSLAITVERLTQRSHKLERQLKQQNDQQSNDQNDRQEKDEVTTIVPQQMITKRGTTKRKAMSLVNGISRIPVVPLS